MLLRVDLYEVDGEFIIEAELPGSSPSDISLEVGVDRVRISGCRSKTKPVDESIGAPTAHRRERSFGRFVREIPLPMPVLRDAALATLSNGILTIRLMIRKADPPCWTLPIEAPRRSGRPVLDCIQGGECASKSRR